MFNQRGFKKVKKGWKSRARESEETPSTMMRTTMDLTLAHDKVPVKTLLSCNVKDT